MRAIGNANYTPVLRWKKGEYRALEALDPEIKDQALPNIILPPLKARDIELGRQLSRAEFARVQVARISQQWGHRACIVDTRHMQLAKDQGGDAEKLSAFFAAAHQTKCFAIPLLDLRTNEHRMDVICEYRRLADIAPAICISMAEIDRPDLARAVHEKLSRTQVAPQDCLAILDLAEADFSQLEQFTPVVIEWVHKLQSMGPWQRIIVEASSFPEYIPARPNKTALVKRKEWMNWTGMLNIDANLADYGIFGDYGPDNANIDFMGGGMPVAHLRYATQNAWFIARGGLPNELGDGSIKQAARWIIESPYFAGETFSLGDETIMDWAVSRIGVRTASDWRLANMNHHMTHVVRDLAVLRNQRIEQRTTRRTVPQESLFQ